MDSHPFAVGVLEGGMSASVGITLDVLSVVRRAAESAGRRDIAWDVLGAATQLRLSNGMTVAAKPIGTAKLPPNAVLIIPGIGLDHPEFAGGSLDQRYQEQRLLRRMSMPDVQAFVRLAARHCARGGRVAASCSGVLVLAMAGALDGRVATTHWRLQDFFRRHFPQVRLDTRRMVVDDAGVASAGAAMAQMDLMLYLVRRHWGLDLADLAMRYLLIDSRGTQARYRVWDRLPSSEDDIVRSFEALIEAHLPDVPSVRDAARRLHVTEKTLARRLHKAAGLTPMAVIHSVRMRHAQRLLAIGDLPLEEVAQRVGYANVTSLRKLTLRMAQLPPARLRDSVVDPV